MATKLILQKLYADHFYEAASWHAQRVKKLCDPKFAEYNEREQMTCFHAASCIEMFVTGKVIEYNPLAIISKKQQSEKTPEQDTLIALQSDDILRVDINILVSVHMLGATPMLERYRNFVSKQTTVFSLTNTSIEDVLTQFNYNAKLLIQERNRNVHQHHRKMLSVDPSSIFSRICHNVSSLYGKNSKESRCFSGQYSRDQSALSELLAYCLELPKEVIFRPKRESYQSEIKNIEESYNKFISEYPNGLFTISMVQCPRCKNYAFMIHRTESLLTYWEGEPNNSVSVLEISNPSAASSETLYCPTCNLDWQDDVLTLYSEITQLNYLDDDKTHNMKAPQIAEILRSYLHHMH